MSNDGKKPQGPWGNEPISPKNISDLDDIIKKSRQKFNKMHGGNDRRNILVFIFLAVIFWLGSGLYVVEPEEQGVVLRFGKYTRIADPGLSYHLPAPFESVIKVPVTTVSRVEVGVRSGIAGRRSSKEQSIKVQEESLMLTGDENIVDIDFEVQWKVKDAADFLFQVRDPAETVKNAAESAMREVIGRTKIADALTEGRAAIEQETRDLIQGMLNAYKAGIEVVRLQMREVQPPAAVIDAFRDVQTARADMERMRNVAESYRNDIIPRARGEGEKIIQEAEAYRQEVVARSEGEANRFLAVYQQYEKAKEVTKKRMYLEMMENILTGMDKILIDNKAQNSGVVPYLPLKQLQK